MAKDDQIPNELRIPLSGSKEKGEGIVVDSLDGFISKTQTIGSIEKAVGNTLKGFNHVKTKSVLPENKDDIGYTFFTRPQLNMATKNLLNYRHFYSLLTNNEMSIHRYVRSLLDPRIFYPHGTAKDGKSTTEAALKSPLLDEKSAFMSILTNTVKSVSGWPDMVNSSFTSKSGVRKEQYSMVDGIVDIYEAFDLDCTFRNMKEEPITLIFDTWLHYMSAVFEGVLSPYLDMIVENEIDYNTRIYRVVLGENKKYVKKIAATGASYPLNVPIGKFFDYTDERPYSDQTKDITVRFKCMGALYNDAILIKEFNDTVGIFNKDMRDLNAGKTSHGLEKIPSVLLERLNHTGYPRINPKTFEFEWWVDKETVENLEKEMSMNILTKA